MLHPSQEHREGLAGFFESRLADMVAAQPRQSIHRFRVMPCELKVGFGTGDEECSSIGNQCQSEEVHVATIHQIERSCFEEETVEPSHVVLARPSNVDAGGNRATQVDLGVHLDSCLRLPEIRPWKKSERKIDRGGIQRIDRIIQIDAEILAHIKGPCLADQALGEVFPYPPVPIFVGFGERRFGNLFGEAKVIESFGSGIEVGGAVAKSIPRCHLGKDHADELLSALEMTNTLLCSISGDEPGESLAFDECDNLGEDVAAGVHRRGAWKIPPEVQMRDTENFSQPIHYVQFADPTPSVNRTPVSFLDEFRFVCYKTFDTVKARSMKKFMTFSDNKRILSNFVFIALTAQASAGGVAAFKEQKFHADGSATILVYSELIIGNAPFIKVINGAKTVTIDREKFAGNVEVLSALPDTITNDDELKPLRVSLDAIKAFSLRYPKSSSLLQGHITALEKSINQFNSGQVRYDREWIERAKFNSIVEEKRKQLDKVRQADAVLAAENQKRKEEQARFAAEQRDKGLELYEEQWLPKDEVAKLLKRDQENALIAKDINNKSVSNSIYSVFQIIDDGMLIEFHDGNVKQGGLNTSLAFLFGAAKGAAADGDYYKGTLYWCGNYSYVNKLDIKKTVNAYCLNLDDAIDRVKSTIYGSVVDKGDGESNESSGGSASALPEPLQGASSFGSGVFVGREGYFITNAHVVEDAKSITILHAGKKLKAEIVKSSKVADLAILKVNQPIVGITISAEEAEPGQDAYALGFPQPEIQGLEIKITKGVISSGKGINEDDTRFQIDTAVQPGNSGGPLCDKSGNLIGVVVARLNEIAVANMTGSIPQNVNYAIKASEVIAMLRSKSVGFEVTSNEGPQNGIKRASAATGLVIIR